MNIGIVKSLNSELNLITVVFIKKEGDNISFDMCDLSVNRVIF